MDNSALMDLDGPYFIEGKTPTPPEHSDINDKYRSHESIANTTCSTVLLGSNINTNEKVALKFIKRKKENLENIKNEISIQLVASHPRILKIEDYFSYKEYICVVTKYASYGSLHTLITQKYKYGIPEDMARIIMKQILEAVYYLHGIGVAHRDIKPDNFFVLDSNPENPKVVIGDLGFAKFFNDGELSEEFKGTPEFSAPEVIAQVPYSFPADIWSLGASLFFILTGNYPCTAYSISKKKCKLQIVKGQLNYNLLHAMKISEDAIDLIKKMCCVNLKRRISLKDALLHPWITSNQKETEDEFDIANALYKGDDYLNDPVL